MNFTLVSEIVGRIIQTIENTAIATVKAVKSHTFSVKVTNAVKKVDVSGTVIVSNQRKVEEQLKGIKNPIREILTTIKAIKPPKEISVTNFPKYPEFPKIPEEVSVKNFPKVEYPKSIRVDNQPIEELNELIVESGNVVKAIKALKLDPKISVQAPKPEKIVVPPANVTVTQQKIDYEKLAKLLAEQVPDMDYQKLAEVLAKEMSQMVITGGGSSSGKVFSKTDGSVDKALLSDDRSLVVTVKNTSNTSEYSISDIDELGADSYFGEQSLTDWFIMKITNSDPSPFRYATVINNPTKVTYAQAWADRLVITYGTYQQAFE